MTSLAEALAPLLMSAALDTANGDYREAWLKDIQAANIAIGMERPDIAATLMQNARDLIPMFEIEDKRKLRAVRNARISAIPWWKRMWMVYD